MGDQHPRPAVPQDIGHLLRLEMPVDGHGIGAEALGGLGRLDEAEIVAQQQGHRLARTYSHPGEARRGARDAVLQLGKGKPALAAPQFSRRRHDF